MADRNDDSITLPEEWPDARSVLAQVLVTSVENRIRSELRVAAIENKIEGLTAQLSDTQMELHSIRDGILRLNESFRHVSEQNAVLIEVLTKDQAQQSEHWITYDKDQKRILRILSREDKWRFAWRLALLVGLYATLFAILIKKLTPVLG